MDSTSFSLLKLLSDLRDHPAIIAILVLFVVIWWLFRMIDRRDQITIDLTKSIDGLKEQMGKNREVQSSLLTMIEVMVYGQQRRGSNGSK
jgi:uncharacterized membrane protein YqiK